MALFLSELRPGDAGIVLGYEKGMTAYKGRLLAMGLTRGTRFAVERVAPLGDPVEITIRGFALSLRKHEAASVVVKKEEAPCQTTDIS